MRPTVYEIRLVKTKSLLVSFLYIYVHIRVIIICPLFLFFFVYLYSAVNTPPCRYCRRYLIFFFSSRFYSSSLVYSVYVYIYSNPNEPRGKKKKEKSCNRFVRSPPADCAQTILSPYYYCCPFAIPMPERNFIYVQLRRSQSRIGQ